MKLEMLQEAPSIRMPKRGRQSDRQTPMKGRAITHCDDRGRAQMLAEVLACATVTQFQCLTTFEIANAFATVPIDKILTAAKQGNYLCRLVTGDVISKQTCSEPPAEKEYALLQDCSERSLRDGHQNARGISQGSPLSPIAFNIFAEKYVDPIFEDMERPFRAWRYIDDFCVLTLEPEGGTDPAQLCQNALAEHGMALRPTDATSDLGRGQSATVLGLTLVCVEGKFRYVIPGITLREFGLGLKLCSEAGDIPSAVRSFVCSWLHSYAPGLQEGNRVDKAVWETLNRYSPGIVPHHKFRSWKDAASNRWQETVNDAMQRV